MRSAVLDPGRGNDDLRAMQREAVLPNGLRRLVRCVARAVDGHVLLLDEAGRPVDEFAPASAQCVVVTDEDVERVRVRETDSIASEHGSRVAVVLSVGPNAPGPVLVVAGDKPDMLRARDLLADATRLFWMCWQVREAERLRQRFGQADSRMREAVLHLLMLGDQGGAGRVAAALGPPLTDLVRFYVLESSLRGQERDALVADCASLWKGHAWVVRCPVYTRHVIVIAPADGPRPVGADDGDGLGHNGVGSEGPVRVLGRGDLHVGASQVVALRDAATGYEQAFHALAAARASAEGYAQFNPREDLASLLGATGRRWANEVLAPLVGYVPDRPQDPDAAELRSTLKSWLAFHTGAARQLKIHRNTLSARVRRVEALLGRDVHEMRNQATLNLALRILDQPRSPGSADRRDELDSVLATPTVRHWARRQLAPLLGEDAQHNMRTLRVWLDSNARLDMASTQLGLSIPGMRKRLMRLEAILERSVLQGPSARADLWLALRIHDGLAF